MTGRDERRLLALACVAALWLLGGAVLGMHEALGYLAPTFALLACLVAGRYPGEHVLLRRVERPAIPRVSARRSRRPVDPARCLIPRGGLLLGFRLAGRAPPSFG